MGVESSMNNEKGPFVLVQDDDSHWYVIPKAAQGKWSKWIGSPEYADGDIPNYAEAVGGSPSLVEFDAYVLN